MIDSKSQDIVWLQRDKWYRRYKVHKDSIELWTFTVILTLKTAIWFLLKTPKIMMMYYQMSFNCKMISSSAHMVETVIFDYMSPHCNPQLQDFKPVSLHTLWPKMIHQHTKFGYRRFSSCGNWILDFLLERGLSLVWFCKHIHWFTSGLCAISINTVHLVYKKKLSWEQIFHQVFC